jgi:hypothetical protein
VDIVSFDKTEETAWKTKVAVKYYRRMCGEFQSTCHIYYHENTSRKNIKCTFLKN